MFAEKMLFAKQSSSGFFCFKYKVQKTRLIKGAEEGQFVH
uniref:Uncharacterized protein n=1 Tax=Rhizophora mucronata TaxID=61149 RepID=A0A2P2J453_RHIMU